MNRGKLVIVAILVVGMGLASFAWWNRWSRSQQVIAHWGAEAPLIIRTGKTVQLLQLGQVDDAEPTAEVLQIGPESRSVTQVWDISQTPGLIHARHQLVQNEAFDWDQARASGCQSEWQAALRFRRGERETTVAFDFACNRAMLIDRGMEVSMTPIAAGMQAFLRSVVAQGSQGPADDANDEPL